MINILADEGKTLFQRAFAATTLSRVGGTMRRRLEARVHGLVQGVFFRHFTRSTAQELGLSGTVANCPDGTVFVVAEGPQESLDRLLDWLKRGPELARVERVDVQWSQPSGPQSGFAILR